MILRGGGSEKEIMNRDHCICRIVSDWVKYLWPHNFLTNDNHARIGYISRFDCGPSVQMKS